MTTNKGDEITSSSASAASSVEASSQASSAEHHPQSGDAVSSCPDITPSGVCNGASESLHKSMETHRQFLGLLNMVIKVRERNQLAFNKLGPFKADRLNNK